jgi:hypothetical protein
MKILIDYLDKQLNTEEMISVQDQIQEDRIVTCEYQYLKLAIDAVRRDAILSKVFSIRHSFANNQSDTAIPGKSILRNMYHISMRVAAISLLLLVSAILYKYITVNNQSFYNSQFTPYELSTTRGLSEIDAISEAYSNHQWNEVVAMVHTIKVPSNKTIFLGAMAEMQLNHFPQAINQFEKILYGRSGDQRFLEESEYYSFLAYMMNHQENKAVNLLNKIKANTDHMYYPMVSQISSFDLKIIGLKS